MAAHLNAAVLLLIVVPASLVPALDAGRPSREQHTSADIVIRAADISQSRLNGGWTLASDETSPGGLKLTTGGDGPDALAEPLADPVDFFDLTFTAAPHTPYRVWLRLQASGNSPSHDSVWVQFSDAEVDGTPAYRLGSRQGLLVKLEGCRTCGDSGWGWQDSSWMLAQPAIVTFASDAPHLLRVQVRQAGVQLDQIVLSPERYLNGPPGPTQADTTTVNRKDHS